MVRRGNERTRRVRAIIVPLIVFVGMTMGGVAVRADETPQFGIRPAAPGADPASSTYFILKGKPGETLHDSVVVANPGAVPVKLLVYPVDAATGQNGGAVYMNNTDPRTDVGAWIKLETPAVEVAPQQQVSIGFTLAIPQGTRGGQHLGGIVAQYQQAPTPATAASGGGQNAGFGITTVTRALTAVLLNVGDDPGTPSLKVTGAQIADVDGLPTLTITMQNDGGILIKPHGDVTVTDAAGKQVLVNQISLDTVVPQTTIAYPIPADPPSVPGTYKVHVAIDFGGGAPAIYDGSLVVSVKVTATPSSGRSRLGQATAVAAASTVPASPSRGGISPLVIALGGLGGAFVIVTTVLVVVLARSRKRP